MKTLRDLRELLRQESFGVDYIVAIDAAIAREEQTARSFEEWWTSDCDTHWPRGMAETAFAAGRASRDTNTTPPAVSVAFRYTCKLCGKPRLEWQVYCGAACCARWERGERPKDVQEPKP
jgi:hypothetical protein